ncbi:DUF2996 domain-containing protein [Myxosarcina sp. GI1]|uniref:DUF2996 domain-containing protein n=1 Tax=Myxosarcina sp. GI1 TaxID=1541065 RepID=UPI0005682A0D|nr:DUF2996 domain-containing protein [Myxosarcina sp. GI1]
MAEETNKQEEGKEAKAKSAEETNKQEGKDTKAKSAAKNKPADKKKQEKPEDKPFTEFIEEYFTPALQKAFADEGIEDINLTFTKQNITLEGAELNDECWQVIGNWQQGKRQFKLYFPEEDITGKKAFSYSAGGAKPSTIESFMIDERKVTLDLLVMYVLQRLNAQKWLTRN